MSSEPQNDFLLGLLDLQQDGKYSISAPTNWTHEPLLEVSTGVDTTIEELQDAVLVGNNANDTARWHFFVGSPGNGKSAAMGKLCRMLVLSKGCKVRDDETGIPITELESTAIPYAINVYEGDNKYVSAQIVQDASVVRNPFSASVDPAAELLDTLKHAWEKGISLVVCTNRGVLEKAHRDNHMDSGVNKTPWFKVLATVVSGENRNTSRYIFDAKKPVFRELAVGYSQLDNRSLLLGKDTFSRLVQKAVGHPSWEHCSTCSACSTCPFKSNRDWLADGEAGERVLQLLRRAEVMSGQVVVFREALALLSLVLSGCSRDYVNVHPCDWVRARLACNDFFSLATRRIYMTLFASHCPHGLEAVDKLRKQQIVALKGLHQAMAEASASTRAALGHVVEGNSPSTDVGVTRLLGARGILANLDPCREDMPAEFYDTWDSDFDAVASTDNACLTDLERACLSIWKELEEGLELAADHSVSEAHWALRRWSSNFLLHAGALSDGYSAWSGELDDFARLLGLLAKPRDQWEKGDRKAVRELDARLENLLGGTESKVRLSESVTLSGQWVQNKLKPRTVGSEASGSVSLGVEFEGGERAVFAAPMYLWLSRRERGRLDGRCFPQELLVGVEDARVRAAARGKYALENHGIELVVDIGEGKQLRITRFDGEVDVGQ